MVSRQRFVIDVCVDLSQLDCRVETVLVGGVGDFVLLAVGAGEPEASDNLQRLVLGSLVLELGGLFSLLAVALLVTEVVTTDTDVVGLLLLDDCYFGLGSGERHSHQQRS